MKQARRVSEAWLQLEPELIISEHWEHLPPPDRGWVDEKLNWVRAILEDEPWTRWDQADWINALVFAGVTLAVLGNVATFIAEVRRASTVR
jgi:hypothetical protein